MWGRQRGLSNAVCIYRWLGFALPLLSLALRCINMLLHITALRFFSIKNRFSYISTAFLVQGGTLAILL